MMVVFLITIKIYYKEPTNGTYMKAVGEVLGRGTHVIRVKWRRMSDHIPWTYRKSEDYQWTNGTDYEDFLFVVIEGVLYASLSTHDERFRFRYIFGRNKVFITDTLFPFCTKFPLLSLIWVLLLTSKYLAVESNYSSTLSRTCFVNGHNSTLENNVNDEIFNSINFFRASSTEYDMFRPTR